MKIEIVNRVVSPVEDELLRVFALLDTEGQTDVLAEAYKNLIRVRGLCNGKETSQRGGHDQAEA